MSIARQIYYNAIFGAIGGLLAWLLMGSVDTGAWPIWTAYPVVGAGVGLCIGGLTGAVDGAINKRRVRPTLVGGVAGALVGLVGGVLGLLLGEIGFLALGGGLLGRTLGWMLFGLFLGIGQGIIARSQRRTAYGALGGLVAGVVGGLLYESMTQAFLRQSDLAQMFSGGFGLILIGACLGGIIPLTIAGLAQGRLFVLNGRRAEFQVVVVDAVVMGSYDGCQLYLPDDPGIDRKHARVYRQGGHFFLEDLGSRSGLFADGQWVTPGAPRQIGRGTRIRLGTTEVELR